jgi:signal transduction histidine kinase
MPADPVVEVDRNKMRQVVDNLINNAVKYSPRGSVITVIVHASNGVAGFAVRDNGPGIPESERHKLFKDYGRLSAQPTGGEKSTGLGLAICRKIVEAHNGTISVENIPGRGAEFVVSLPLHK